MQTIIDLFESSVTQFGLRPFMWQKSDGKYLATTYEQTKEQAQQFAKGLIELGVEQKDHIALLSEGRNAWIICELGVLYTGAVNVPLSIKLEASEVLFRVNHSEAKFLIVSRQQAPKIELIKEKFTHVKHIIYIDGADSNDEGITFSEVIQKGQSTDNKEIENRKKSLTGKSLANISYTSGTTSDPKGIILTHRNYTANVEQAYSLMDIPADFKTLLILPLDHCFAHVAGIYSFMGKGASLAMVEAGKTPLITLKNIPKNIQEI
nr:AMP-binding protein [Salinivirgaceae bacterium]